MNRDNETKVSPDRDTLNALRKQISDHVANGAFDEALAAT